jgi:hypothetical protein
LAPTIRLNTDEEVISRVAKVVMSRSRRQELLRQFKDLTPGVAGASVEVDAEDLKRIEEIVSGMDRSVEEVESLVLAILDGGFLESEVSKAIEGAATRAVSERASTIRAEAEQQAKEVRQALEERRKELASVDADLERRRRVREAEIEGELSARKKSAEIEIRRQRDSVARQQTELDRQRKVIEQNLSKVVRSFSEEKDKLITDFLAIRPILESAGVLGSPVLDRPNHETEARITRQDPPISLPEVLSSERGRATILRKRNSSSASGCTSNSAGSHIARPTCSPSTSR